MLTRNKTCLVNGAKIHLISTISLHYVHREAKYNKSELQNLQDLKETGKGLVILMFKLGYYEEQLFMTLSMSSDKIGIFLW